MERSAQTTVIGPEEGELLGADGLFDRFLLDGEQTDGAFALVEHRIPPGVLAAPLHRHSREDEYSFVLEGRIGAVLDGTAVEAGEGELVLKPRGQWHTFWNPGDRPLRLLELISPGGFEQLFRELHAAGGELTPEVIAPLAERYAVEIDFEATMGLVEEHGLSM